jgi:hypothetical protein
VCSVGFGSVVGSFSSIPNENDLFYSLNLPTTFLSRGLIEIELEVPAQTTASISFAAAASLTLFLSLIISDVDPEIGPELTLDNTLAPPF